MQALIAFAVFFLAAFADNTKRSTEATTCASVDMLDLSLCPSASEGAYCLSAAEAGEVAPTCGCKQDADCFNAAAFPFCVKNTVGGGSCDFCTSSQTGTNPATDVSDHQFCRFRFPSTYLLNPPADLMGTPLPTGENVASATTPNAYFREVCNRNAAQGGACEGCHQASPTNTPDIASQFPSYPVGLITLGMFGSIHCRHVYSTAPKLRPICAFRTGYFDVAFSPSVWTTMTGSNEIGNGLGVVTVETRTVNLWQGACFPCVFETKARHGLCARSDPSKPICNADGSCGKCSTNVQCQVNAACLADGTCTANYGTQVGLNCFVDGHCGNCTTDNDCGALDGGEVSAQPTCQAGVCVDAVPCASNGDCPTGTNCMSNGKCVACTAGTQCRTQDGPPGTNADGISGQPKCVAGVCIDCNLNADCVGTGGANCEANGQCQNCGNSLLNSPVCGTADGGAATPATIADASGQTLCNTNTQICETPCNTNLFCGQKGGSDAFTRGANCQADGTCKDCTTSPSTCGSLDGGEISGQSTCDTTLKLCFNPFSCNNNADCASAANTGGGNNCQSNNQCVNCVVTYTSTTCSANDGGEVNGQPNCNQASRLCVNACNNNADCVGTQGANCMENGVCFDCRTDADCQTGNAWNGDKGGDTICTGNICTPACTRNSDCPANQNCMKTGRCVACTNDADCVSNDGPPPMGTNTVCTNGVCVNPYECVANAQDNANCLVNTGQANCQADRSCKTCTSNTDCGVLDGGLIPGQPKCQSDGTCGPCQVNADCPAALPNCGADGSCYDCRSVGERCGSQDGGEIADQQNCDSRNGICTNFCTSDANCAHLECSPYCNIDKGCCVECTSDNHCPYSHWSGAEALKTVCVDSWCVVPEDCWTDADCPAATPACVPLAYKCVGCLYDSHCSGSTPACSVAEQVCVECVNDGHCVILNTADETFVCGSDQVCTSGAGALSVLGALALTILTVALF